MINIHLIRNNGDKANVDNLYNTNIKRNIMKMRRQTEDINASEYVIRRPLYWPVFILIFFVTTLLLCFWDTPSTEVKDIFDVIAVGFYLFAGFSIWIPITVIAFVLLAMNFYMYFRFKLVIHGHCFTVTPLLGATHDVAFFSVEKVTHSKRFSNKGYYIDIEYDNKKIHIPYTLNRKGTFKQKSIDVLLKKLENYKTNITED